MRHEVEKIRRPSGQICCSWGRWRVQRWKLKSGGSGGHLYISRRDRPGSSRRKFRKEFKMRIRGKLSAVCVLLIREIILRNWHHIPTISTNSFCYKSLRERSLLQVTLRASNIDVLNPVSLPPSSPPDYIIRHYGNGRFVATSPDNVDLDIFWSHFAEGSLMPTLVMKLIFTIIPTQAPFLVRPLVNAVCSGVNSKFVDPDVSFLSIWSIARCLCASWLTPFRFPFVRIG